MEPTEEQIWEIEIMLTEGYPTVSTIRRIADRYKLGMATAKLWYEAALKHRLSRREQTTNEKRTQITEMYLNLYRKCLKGDEDYGPNYVAAIRALDRIVKLHGLEVPVEINVGVGVHNHAVPLNDPDRIRAFIGKAVQNSPALAAYVAGKSEPVRVELQEDKPKEDK